MSIAKQMWDYLKSIGFVDIPNDDKRLGCQGNEPLWKSTIARDDLCVYNDLDDDDSIGVINLSKRNWGFHSKNLGIHSVQDLENWLRKEYPEFYEEENNMITKDNIEEVLKHNEVNDFSIEDGFIVIGGNIATDCRIGLDNPNLISIIEAHYGRKLEPLPEPNPLIGKWIKCVVENKWCVNNAWYKIHDTRIIDNRIIVCVPDKDGCYFMLNKTYFNFTDIRNYNPDEEIVLKIGDILDIQEYGKHQLTKINYDYEDIRCGSIVIIFDGLDSIKSVNSKRGKFVIPPFDFEQTLLDAGFSKSQWNGRHILVKNGIRCELLTTGGFCYGCNSYHGYRQLRIKPNPANARRLIEAAAILNELELAK